MNTNSSILTNRISPGSTIKPRILDGLAKKLLLNRLRGIKDGELLINDGNETYTFGRKTKRCSLSVQITVKDNRFYGDITFGGSIGAGEAYMADYWDTTHLTNLIRLFVINRHVLENVELGIARLTSPIQKVMHWLNRNSLTGSRRNIAAHYDLGNDFFSAMLDPTMMYSSAIFIDTDTSLHEAQLYRLDQICKKLDLQSNDHLLEIGTGWGGLSIYAAKHYGCQVTTTTISREQYEYSRERIKEEGLEDKINVLFEDYRNLYGQYNKLVSIEMIEAVGHQYYDTYFKKCSDLLTSDGMMLLQAITISDQNYDVAKKSVDFIQSYIFPGSCIPSNTAILSSATKSTDMRLYNLSDIGPHYATTLNLWRANFLNNLDTIKDMGYDNKFIRMWDFYLCYCEGGFIERAISDVHMLFVKPDNRCTHLV